MRRTISCIALIVIFIAVWSGQVAWGQIPRTISYQGVLTDAKGNAVPDGAYTMTFKLYEQATGGTVLWQEQQSVTVSKGILNVILGRVAPLALSFDRPFWLGISIAGNPELTPRTELTASAYSLNARGVYGESNVFPSDDSVGIGTTKPKSKLHVEGGVRATQGFFAPAPPGPIGGIGLFMYSPSSGRQIIEASNELHIRSGTGNGFSGEIIFLPNDIESMRLHGKNVGIGTGPNPTEKLQVAGVIHSTTGGYKFPDGTVQTTAATGGGGGVTLDQAYDFGGAGAGRTILADAGPVSIDGPDGLQVNGNIGIGVAATEGRLHVESGALARAIYAKATGTSSLAAHFETQEPNNNFGTVSIFNQGTGIGLTVRQFGAGGRAGSFLINNTSNNEDALFALTTGTGHAVYARTSGTGNALVADHRGVSGNIASFRNDNVDQVVITKTGNVGIGTSSPGERLQVQNGNAKFFGDIIATSTLDPARRFTMYSYGSQFLKATNDVYFDYVGSAHFRNSGQFAMKIHSSGNVGIGDFGAGDDPTEKLQVRGTIHSTTGGFRFPDGTLQTTAAIGGGGGVTLDQAYDFGGPGAGRTIVTDAGPVNIIGPDGLRVNAKLEVESTARRIGSFRHTGTDTLAIAVEAHAMPQRGIGVGGIFQGGFIGVEGGATGGNDPNFSYSVGLWGSAGGVGSRRYGVWGYARDGATNYGIYGEVNDIGGTNYGIFGFAGSTGGWNYAVYGRAVRGQVNYAGYFDGNVAVTGNLVKGGGAFKIDHPLNPQNQNLYHSFVESPDMMNIYNGNVTLDTNGEAVVTLPAWFEALNKDFRYQLTCIGGFAPVYIADEIAGNRFKIAGGQPGLKVSWQVTGIRHDAFAEKNRIPVEENKPAHQRGKYLHPEAFGMPETMGVDYKNEAELHRTADRH